MLPTSAARGAASQNPSRRLQITIPQGSGREGRPAADGAREGARPPVRVVCSCSGCAAKAMAKGGAATVLAVLAAAVLLCLRDPATAALPRLEHPAKNDESLSLLVVGDWGRKGECNQYRVVEQMGRVGEKLDIDLMVSTGDNFYDTGLTGVDDDAFEKSFMDIYTRRTAYISRGT